jgi:nucleotide-binding universal stress UspA family protein
MSRITRILVPTDFSPAAEIAVSYALDLAAQEGAAIHLLHVVGDLALTAAYADALAIELPGLRESLVADAQRRLDQVAAAAQATPVAITTGVLVGGVASVITGEAADRGADLIVMGTHGRGGFAHALLGSVAERIVRTAPCSVLTVRDTSLGGGRHATITSHLARHLEC